jgi:16S rRNA (guanine1207-N2)-methyltransferase
LFHPACGGKLKTIFIQRIPAISATFQAPPMMQENFKAYSNPTQLLGMLDLPLATRLLVALPPEAGLQRAFQDRAAEVAVWHHDFATACLESGPSASVSLYPPPGPFDLVYYYLPKARDYQAYTLNMLAPCLTDNARLVAVGPKNGGAASANRMLAGYGDVGAKHGARHCVAWECAPAAGKAGAEAPAGFEASAWGQTAKLISLPGVFNHGRLDDGTRLLLDTVKLQGMKFKSALDWGCGTGVIGLLLKLARPECAVTFSDVSAVALESTRRNLEQYKLSSEKIIASDGYCHLQDHGQDDIKFDLILTNPPAHKGLASDHSVSERFLRETPRHLNPGGRLILVTNAHLPYIKIMEKEFKRVAILAKTPRFHVIEGKV